MLKERKAGEVSISKKKKKKEKKTEVKKIEIKKTNIVVHVYNRQYYVDEI